MRFTDNLLLLAAAGTHVAAQTPASSSAVPTSTSSPGTETGKLGDALVVENNPVGVVYKAVLPETAFFEPAFPEGGNIKGEVKAQANPDGKGVVFTINLTNLPKVGGPIPYHLHVDPVPENGNCTATLAHLDPFERGEATPCDEEKPETCQVGDLSGKHGAIPEDADEYSIEYVDEYASTLEGIGAFFGNRSIVFHYPNKTRITCASFAKVKGGATLPPPGSNYTTTAHTPSATASGTDGGVSEPTTTSPPLPGAAAGVRAGIAGAVVFAAAAVFML